MINKKEKELILLRVGLSLRKIIAQNKLIAKANKEQGVKDKNLIDSFDKLDAASGTRKATLIDISLAKSNATSTTIVAILEALKIKMTDFGKIFDDITEVEVLEYKANIEKGRKSRVKKKEDSKFKKKRKN